MIYISENRLKTSVTYKGTGAQTQYDFPFDYLRKSFIKVKIDDVLQDTSEYNVDNRSILFKTAPAADSIIVIYRETDTERLVSWADASVLKASDMTVSQVQQLHILEEGQDWSKLNTIYLDKTDNSWEGNNHKIKNVSYPVNDDDVVTKGYMETVQGGFVMTNTALKDEAAKQAGIATTKASEAAASASAAATSETNAASSANTAKRWAEASDSPDNTTSKSAKTWASEASTSASAAKASETNAKSSETKAANSATTATEKAGIATAKANEASASASAAKTSETNAASSATNAQNAATNAQNASDKLGDTIKNSNACYLYSFFENGGQKVHLFVSDDGRNLTRIDAVNVGDLHIGDISLLFYKGYFLMAASRLSDNPFDFAIYRSRDLIDWEYHKIDVGLRSSESHLIWAPEFFVDDNNDLYVTLGYSDGTKVRDIFNDRDINYFNPYITKCVNFDTLQFCSATLIRLVDTDTKGNPAWNDNKIDPSLIKKDGVYYLFIKDEFNKYIEEWSSTDLKAWTKIADEINGIGQVEAPFVLNVNGTYYLYCDDYSLGGEYYYVTSKDLITWSDNRTRVQCFNNRIRHGSGIRLNDDIALNTLNKFIVYNSTIMKGKENVFNATTLIKASDDNSDVPLLLASSNPNISAIEIPQTDGKNVILFTDGRKTGLSEEEKLGYIGYEQNTEGDKCFVMKMYNGESISVGKDKNGQSLTYAPSPPTKYDNSNKIATTNWTINLLADFVLKNDFSTKFIDRDLPVDNAIHLISSYNALSSTAKTITFTPNVSNCTIKFLAFERAAISVGVIYADANGFYKADITPLIGTSTLTCTISNQKAILTIPAYGSLMGLFSSHTVFPTITRE